MEEQVILVNNKDTPLGLASKTEAHKKGLLHRAFSVFIFNSKGEIMLQQRASHKYHSPLLWTNTCCSHQRKGESNIKAGERRLQEEMGFHTPLEETTNFIYKTVFDNGLIEHEYDYILKGTYDDNPCINTNEVADWKWKLPKAIMTDIEDYPHLYSAWFKIIFEKYFSLIKTFSK